MMRSAYVRYGVIRAIGCAMTVVMATLGLMLVLGIGPGVQEARASEMPAPGDPGASAEVGALARIKRNAIHRAPILDDTGAVGILQGPGEFTIWTIDDADGDLESLGQRYAIVCTISAQDVQGQAHLEMLSTIDGKEYFTRTAGHGLMRPVSGTSDATKLALPFDTLGETSHPTRIALRVVMPAEGTITVRSAALAPITREDLAFMRSSADAGAWWSPRASGLIGGLAGSLIGVIGGIVGMLAHRGAARTTAMVLMGVVVGVGAAGLCVGVAALAMEQPYAVWYPGLLLGVLCLTIGPVMWVGIRKQYETHELGRMAALDAG